MTIFDYSITMNFQSINSTRYLEAVSDIRKWENQDPQHIEELLPGANSFTLKFILNESSYVYKRYNQRSNDKRNRFQSEVTALKFFSCENITSVPQLVYIDPDQKFIIYKHIEGRFIQPQELDQDLIKKALDFYFLLFDVTKKVPIYNIGFASDAYLSIHSHIENINQKLNILKTIQHLNPNLLEKKILSLWKNVQEQTALSCKKYNIDMKQNLPAEKLLLSQSDVGFHNILYNNSQNISFIDFEYFGLDDPAKLICDFLLQPKIPLSTHLQKIALHYFYTYLSFEYAKEVLNRSRILFYVIAFKWCIIMLNPLIYHIQNEKILPNQELDIQLNKIDSTINRINEMIYGDYSKHLFDF